LLNLITNNQTRKGLKLKEYDEETKKIADGAKSDLHLFLANAGKNTTEKELEMWRAGYIAGVNRAMGIKQ